MTDHGLDLAVIGNCRTAAFVDPTARLVWWCFPRFDSDPVFSRLLAGNEEKGFSDVVLDGMADFQSDYVRNTTIVSTVLTDTHGNAVRITDFAPRFRQYGRIFRPPQLFRIIEPVTGLPRITIRIRPTHAYGKPLARHSMGSNHIRYFEEGGTALRVTTDAPLALIENETPFVLTRPMYLVFGNDEAFPGDLASTAQRFAEETKTYWLGWVRRLYISYEWQEAIIRAAITLKLCTFEETGGIVAAPTTSLPERLGGERNWDYRFCWLRDATLTLLAFIVRACVRTLQHFPQFNASLDESRQNLVYKKYFHIGFAADTPNGLLVPVVRDADRKDVYEIARALAELSAKARDGKLPAADMQGGSFTISSLGGIGGTAFTPIINAPEVAILGVSRSGMKPVWQGGSFVPRLMLPLSLSYDHRVIDGAAAARFTTYLAAQLADPQGLLEAVP